MKHHKTPEHRVIQAQLSPLIADAKLQINKLLNQTISEIEAKTRETVSASLKYVGWLLNSSCAPDLLKLQLYPNIKEWTESAGAYHAVQRYLPEFPLNDKETTMVAVGDGCVPRTAALFAFRTGWQCYSVDPKLKLRNYNVNRLYVRSARIEDTLIEATKVVIVLVHSHARLEAALKSIKGDKRAVIALPCCVKLECEQPHDFEYKDVGILSEKNVIKVWKQV